MSPFEQADYALGQWGKYWKKNYTGLGGGELCPIVYTLLYTISDRKGTPFIYLLLIKLVPFIYLIYFASQNVQSKKGKNILQNKSGKEALKLIETTGI